MRMEDLMPGCKVDIRITQLMEKEDVDAAQGIYYTSIFDVTKDSIELQMPMVGGRLQLLPKNICYEFIFSAPMGLYKAQGTVTDHIKKQHFYLVKIVLTSPLEKFQRREYYRITCMVPMIFMGVTEEAAMEGTIDAVREKMAAGNEMTVRGIGTILDISGGGARFTSSNSLANVKYLLLEFQLPQENKKTSLDIDVVAKVIDSKQTDAKDKYTHRVKFYFKDPRMKEQLIGYVFQEERRIRKKEQEI